MTSNKTKVVTSRKDGDTTYHDFRCPYPTGCGVPGGDPFASVGWSNRDDAVARGRQHIAEHESVDDPDREVEPMPELHEFRTARGITPEQAGQDQKPTDWEF